MLINHQWGLVAFTWGQFHRKHSKYLSLILLWELLTHWGREKMDAISQTTFWSAFSWMKMFEFRLKFHWSLFLRVKLHTMDLLWEKFQWILPLYMKPISFQSKVSIVCSVTAAIFIGFCLKKINVFSQHIGKKTNEYLNSADQIPRNWNVDHISVLITSWDII